MDGLIFTPDGHYVSYSPTPTLNSGYVPDSYSIMPAYSPYKDMRNPALKSRLNKDLEDVKRRERDVAIREARINMREHEYNNKISAQIEGIAKLENEFKAKTLELDAFLRTLNNGDKHDDKYDDNNDMYDDKYSCSICMDNDINAVFIPCGHIASCYSCGQGFKNCPICRVDISGVYQIYLP